ncbi:MAG: hypothetical protein K2R93_14875 [Gemmatimonadaceae bacterium]|nr:hypothetical protein [Gemmatimonadaceae bacterium]
MWGTRARMQAMVALATACVVTPTALAAQDEPTADFKAAHEQFAAGQLRPAANTLLRATLYIRQQVGRSRDETTGMQLLNAEGAIEKLALGLREGRTMSVKAFDQELVRVDRLLAQHYVQMAVGAIAHPKANDCPVIARDIRQGAFHYERTITLDGRSPLPEVATLLTDVRTLATEIESTKAVPKTAAATLAVLDRQISGATVMAVSQR